jgi:uncharacterized protein YjbI with pentapeptide repeats
VDARGDQEDPHLNTSKYSAGTEDTGFSIRKFGLLKRAATGTLWPPAAARARGLGATAEAGSMRDRRLAKVSGESLMAATMRWTGAVLVALCGLLAAARSPAQDMMRYVDLASPDMTTAEMTRGEVEHVLAAATPEHPADFAGKRLSGLDLSGLDLTGALLRGARLNKAKLVGARLDRAILDQAWLMEADLGAASLKGASLFATQMQRAKLDGADLSGARIIADLTGASLVGVLMVGANLAADMKNQSMGLMHAILKSAKLDGADIRNADLSRADLEFASLKRANLAGASLRGAALGGADLTGVTVSDTDFLGADLASTRLAAPIGLEAARNLDKAENLRRAIRE